MKTIVALALLLALAEANVDFNKIRDECLTKTGVSQESVKKALDGEVVDDPKVGETALCSYQKGGLIDDQGNIKVEETQNAVKAGMGRLIDRIVNDCAAASKKSTPEATSAAFLHCVRKDTHRLSTLN